jgi:hypothetical protein
MVKLHIKKGDDSHFLYETTVSANVEAELKTILNIYNGRLKVDRLCSEIEYLSKAGITLPPNMQGLTDEQITELKLVDEWGNKCIPSGGYVEKRDELGRRNGRVPNEKMAELLMKTVKEAKEKISKQLVSRDICITEKDVQEALDVLKGACMIVYPMGLPPYDNIQMEFDNEEDLSGTQASKEVIPPDMGSIWFSGKEMLPNKVFADYLGKNEKSKVIAKIQRKGAGAPGREPVVGESEQKQMMAYYYKKQEEMKVSSNLYLRLAIFLSEFSCFFV